ncbi:MAG TPA: hypothetical protein VG994_18555 [Steroidobacteraceae bacterium]|nr:hypothetical protein [Steroidobacteraceae bacterium]
MLRRSFSNALIGAAAFGASSARTSAAEPYGIPAVWPPTPTEARLRVPLHDPRFTPGDVRRYGAIGDWDGTHGTDNTAALRAALAVCEASGHTMHLPAGRYLISAPLQKPQSFTCPNIRGDGFMATRLVYPKLGANPALYVQGGSGRLCGAVIEGIGFDGGARTCAIEVDGQDGLVIRDCHFGPNALGLRLHNGTTGAFTEYVVAERCHFDGACARAVHYAVSKGERSFNGSGLRDCTIVLDASADVSILIGAGALPYNAPLSFQAWTYGRDKTVIHNASGHPALFHGTIALEAFGELKARSQWPTLASGAGVYLVGGVLAVSGTDFGSLVQGSRASLLGPESGKANGQFLIRRLPWSYRAELTTGTNRLGYIGDQSAQLLYVEVWGRDYDFRFLLTAAHQARGGRGFVHTVAPMTAFDGAGHGPPRFAVDEQGRLLLENHAYPRSGMIANVDVIPCGLSRTAFLDAALEY